MSESLSTEGLAADVAALPLGSNAQVFTASGPFTVPDGVTTIKAREWGGAGGAGGGASGDAVTDGGDGTAGEDSYVGAIGNKARGGLPGHGGLANGNTGADVAAQAPIFSSNSFQSGTFAVPPYAGLPTLETATNGRGQILLNAVGGLGETNIAGGSGQPGTANTGTGGGCGAQGGFTGGRGTAGGHGEYSEWTLAVVPGAVLPVHVGAGGAGGLGGAGGGPNGGDGGNGGSGLVIIEW